MALYSNAELLPYQRLLVARLTTFERPTLYHNQDSAYYRNTDEWEYLKLYATGYSEGGMIPMSQTQGAIYTETCQSCLVSHFYGGDAKQGCTFCQSLQHNMLLENNTFTSNDDGITFYEDYDLPKASLLYAVGGYNYQIRENTITHKATE